MFFLKKIGRLAVAKRDIECYGKRRKKEGTENERDWYQKRSNRRKMVVEERHIQT